MGKELFLHIGLEKTGTTAIQHFLKVNKDFLGKKYQIDIPTTPGFNTIDTHHKIAKRYLNNQAIAGHYGALKDDELSSLLKGFSSDKISKIIISSELFSYSDEENIKALYTDFKDFDIKILVYLRRQDQYIEAQYSQHVKRIWAMGRKPIAKSEFTTHNLDYYEFVNKWRKKNSDNIFPKIYGFSNSKQQIFEQFFATINPNIISDEALQIPKQNVNPPLSLFHRELMLNYVKKVGDDELRKKIADLIFHHNSMYSSVNANLLVNKNIFGLEYKKALLEQYQECNQKLAKKFPEVAHSGSFFPPLNEAETELLSMEHLGKEEIVGTFFNMMLYFTKNYER